MGEPKWKEFENAVAKFVAALDPKAKVTPDIRLPDVHTSKPRQRDVWIEAKVCKHFPATVLISCKRLKKKLDQKDIDAFNGELFSSGANLGILYSYSGFALNAIEKAKKLGISCCKLFDNEPPDIPNSIAIMKSFCCTPRISISVISPLDQGWNLKNWNELFSLRFDEEGSSISAIDAIVRSYHKGEKEVIERTKETFFPLSWARVVTFIEDEPINKMFRVIIRGGWNLYEGKLEAHLLKGSYNFTSGEFFGSQMTPTVDTQSSHPGPGWSLLNEPPNKSSVKGIRSLFIMSAGNAKDALIENLGLRQITFEEIDPSLISLV